MANKFLVQKWQNKFLMAKQVFSSKNVALKLVENFD